MKRKKELLVVLTSLLVIVLSVTVAYFTVQIIGEGKELSVSTANLQIIYEDTDGSISGSNIKPPWSSTKTFKVTNNSDGTYEYDIIIEDLVNTFVLNYLEYKITSADGGYNMTEYRPVPKSLNAKDTAITNKVSIADGVVHNYTIEFRYRDEDVDQSLDMGKILSGRIMIREGSNPLFKEQLLTNNSTLYTVGEEGSPRASFSEEIYIEENTGVLFTTNSTEDGSTVYYFAGNPTNNWVKFGKDKDGNDLYWRIIRTNEDNSVRLLYHGTSTTATNAYIAAKARFDVDSTQDGYSTDSKYLGYMYGSSGTIEDNRTNQTNSSNAKRIIDDWYANSLNTKTDGTYTYDKYVSKTAIYCNDRSSTRAYYSTDGNNGETAYGASARIMGQLYYNEEYNTWYGDSKSKPSYKCGVKSDGTLFDNASNADKFSASTTGGGNGLLTYPAALITADEIMFAGRGDESVQKGCYLETNSNGTSSMGNAETVYSPGMLTMSPASSPTNTVHYMYLLHFNDAYYAGPTEILSVRPVISIKACANWANGDGSATSPYEISIDATCAAAEN